MTGDQHGACYLARMSTEVTVVIINWNGRRYLEGCLRSIAAQTVTPRRVILVDNASDDDSVTWTRANHPDVDILVRDHNDGPCPARNDGLRAAETDWVLLVDNDIELPPTTLETLLPHRADDVAVVHPRAVFADDPSRIHYDGGEMHFVGIMTLHHFFGAVDEADDTVRDIDAAISMALLVDRRKLLDVGGFDPRHFILFEDHDLSYRLRARGHRIVREPKAIVRHREGTAGLSFRDGDGYAADRVRLHSRNRWIVLLKCHGWRALILGLPGLAMYEAAYLFFALRNRSLGAWCRGKVDVVKLLPGLIRDRRDVQRRRRVRDRELLHARPLTVSPLIRRRGLVARLERLMDGMLRVWWHLVGRLT